MTIGEKIRLQRKRVNMKQEELGDNLGISAKTIQRWEAGERMPNTSIIPNLAKTLNTSVEYLMGVDDAKDVKPEIESSSINNSVESNNDLDLVYWGGVAERAGRAARSGDIQKLTLVAALLQSALNAIMSAGASVPVRIVGMQGNIQGNNNNVKNNVAMAAAGAPA